MFRFPRVLLGATTLAVAFAVGAASSQAPQSGVRPLAHSRQVLPNGLVALFNEDHSSPVVAVDVWYHVGAKNELPGKTGYAHLCEHLMNEGSPNEPLAEKNFVQSIGGTSTRWATTTEDIMHFFATVPRNQLETMLWLESDRMAAPMAHADDQRLAMVRDAIRQERTQDREGQVFGLAKALSLPWLMDVPYRIDPLGPMTDLNGATVADVKQFCLPYFVPNNAVISLSGDFSTAQAAMQVKKYFGGIARGPAPPRPAVTPLHRAAQQRLVLEDARAGGAFRLRLLWAGAAFSSPDRLALMALGSVLSRDRTGRLTKALVYDRPLATRVLAQHFDFEQAGIFQVEVYPRPNVSLTTIEQVADSVLAAINEHGVSEDELVPFKRSNAVVAVTTLQSRAARADTLAHGEIFAGDPVAYATQVARANALTAADILRVERQYLGGDGVVMSMIPAGKLDQIAKPELPFVNVTKNATMPGNRVVP